MISILRLIEEILASQPALKLPFQKFPPHSCMGGCWGSENDLYNCYRVPTNRPLSDALFEAFGFDIGDQKLDRQ